MKSIGFADLKMAELTVTAPAGSLSALTPIMRQRLYSTLEANGIPNERGCVHTVGCDRPHGHVCRREPREQIAREKQAWRGVHLSLRVHRSGLVQPRSSHEHSRGGVTGDRPQATASKPQANPLGLFAARSWATGPRGGAPGRPLAALGRGAGRTPAGARRSPRRTAGGPRRRPAAEPPGPGSRAPATGGAGRGNRGRRWCRQSSNRAARARSPRRTARRRSRAPWLFVIGPDNGRNRE